MAREDLIEVLVLGQQVDDGTVVKEDSKQVEANEKYNCEEQYLSILRLQVSRDE